MHTYKKLIVTSTLIASLAVPGIASAGANWATTRQTTAWSPQVSCYSGANWAGANWAGANWAGANWARC